MFFRFGASGFKRSRMRRLRYPKNETKLMNKGMQQLEYPIIVHSHLGWDWVWQRPQQFFSRLAERHSVLFVEGPVPKPGIASPTVEIRELTEYPNIIVLRRAMPENRWSNGAWLEDRRRRLVNEVLSGPIGE